MYSRRSSTFEQSEWNVYISKLGGENVLTSHAPSIGAKWPTAAARVARETDCPFRRLYGVRNEPQETVTRAKMDRTFEVGWEVIPRGSEKASADPRCPSCSCLSLGETKGQRAVRESGKGEPTAVKAFVVSFWPTLLYERDVVVANVLGPRCVQAVVGRQAPRQEERATLRTQCVFAFLFRRQRVRLLDTRRIAKRCRSNLTLVLPSTTRNDGWVSPRSWDRFHERFRNRQILLTFMRPTRPCEILIRGIELWTLENNKILCVFCGFFGNKVFRRLTWIETIHNYFPIPTPTLSFYFSTATI